MRPRRIAGRSAGVLQHVEVERAESHGGKEAEHQGGHDREGRREEQDHSVNGDVVDARQSDRRHPSQQTDAGLGEQDTERTAGQPQQEGSDNSAAAMRPRLAPTAARTANSR